MQFKIKVEGTELISRSLEEVTAQILRDIEKEAPEQFQQVLDSPPPSEEGNAPAKRTGNLIRSLQARVISPTEAELEMAYYAQHLDPFFDEPNYERPFIQRGMAQTLAQLESK